MTNTNYLAMHTATTRAETLASTTAALAALAPYLAHSETAVESARIFLTRHHTAWAE
jgi:hypothetical protein